MLKLGLHFWHKTLTCHISQKQSVFSFQKSKVVTGTVSHYMHYTSSDFLLRAREL